MKYGLQQSDRVTMLRLNKAQGIKIQNDVCQLIDIEVPLYYFAAAVPMQMDTLNPPETNTAYPIFLF